MANFWSLNAAMVAKDALAEAELRYKLLAETFEAEPRLRANLNPALDLAKAEILQLRAAAVATPGQSSDESGRVVAFDANRFRKTDAVTSESGCK